MKSWRTRWIALSVAALVAACGGGGGDDEGIRQLVAFGDSLSDVGTYNVGTIAQIGAQTGGSGRWTVNSTTGGQMWVEQLSAALKLPAACAAETGMLPNAPGLQGAPVTAHAGCTVYAEGSARVSSALGPNSVALQALGEPTMGLMAKPVKEQMAAHLAASGGRYRGDELVAILVGANDVVMELTLTAPTHPQQAVANVGAAGAELGALIRSEVLAKGAERVLVLKLPAIADTPYVRAISPEAPALVATMTQAFNDELAAALAGVTGVQLADAHGFMADLLANPSRHGLTNVTDVACGPNGLGGSAVLCNASNLWPGDRSHYLFADAIHPTPYGHQLFADFALDQLSLAGWR